jgi:S-DNA-T family DNA segregation ATPase FtsK/SpoIIIE
MSTPWTILFGTAPDGSEIRQDVSKAPHILLAGTTGSGKSASLNALIAGLIQSGTPKDTQLVILDPKFVEFGVWKPAPHVAHVVIDRDEMVLHVERLVVTMEDRYRAMQRAGVVDIAEWHGTPRQVPRLFLVCDELADLLLAGKGKASKDRSARILVGLTRIAQLGRASGVHLLVATQTPRADVLPGCLRANLPSRFVFRVRTRQESRTALDAAGAESLGSNPGTALLSWRGAVGVPTRGIYVDREQCAAVAEAARARYGARSGSGGFGGSSGRVDVSGWLESLPAPVQVALAVAGGTYGAWALGWLG